MGQPATIAAWVFGLAAGCGASGAPDRAAGNDAAAPSNDGSVEAGDELGSGQDGGDSGAIGDGAGDGADAQGPSEAAASSPLKTVFVIMMGSRDWASIQGSASAPYINSLLATAAHAEQYYTPANNHPSEPNYLWLEAGSNLGIVDDLDPVPNHQATTQHLAALLTSANIPWKAYAEDISGQDCPLLAVSNFTPAHTPMLFFDDVTDTNSPTSANCIAHVRPYSELAADLSSNTLARYNFITPNLCNDMDGAVSCRQTNVDEIKAGDTWLSAEVPTITASPGYKDGGVIFLLWDQGTESVRGTADDGPLGCIVLSSKAKAGYASTAKLTHSAVLKTVQEIFGVTPLLGAAAASSDLAEMFTSFP
jgi:hypothetical protein